MTAHPFHAHLARVLDRMGGLYSVNDILGAIARNEMQSFVEGDSWIVTRVAKFPRRRALEVIVALGSLDELRALHDRILAFAKSEDVSVILAYGRKGWLADASARGWAVKARSFVYQRIV
jgi:hypothetical protein